MVESSGTKDNQGNPKGNSNGNYNANPLVPNTMANHAERPEKFSGLNFKRWQQKMFFYFVSRDDSPYFQSGAFGKILQYVSRYPRKCNFREGKGKHSVVISEVPTVASALTICQEILSI